MRVLVALLVAAGCTEGTTTVVRVTADQMSVMHVASGCACADIPVGTCSSSGDETPACGCKTSVDFVIEGVGGGFGFEDGDFAGATLDVDGQRVPIPPSYPPAAVVGFDPAGHLSWSVSPPTAAYASNNGLLASVTCHVAAGVTTAPVGALASGTPSVMTETRTVIDGIDVRMGTIAAAP